MVDPFLRNTNPDENTAWTADNAWNNQSANSVNTADQSSWTSSQWQASAWAQHQIQQTQATNASVKNVKPKGKSFSLKGILFGCLGFSVLIVWLAALVLYLMIQNPDQYASIGLDRATIQVLLQTFAVLFFGVMFFVWFGLLLVNGYRFVTVKNKPKLKYVLSSIVWFVVLLFSIGLWAAVLTRIAALDNRWVDAWSLIIPYLVMEDGPTNILTNQDLRLLAPGVMVFQLNRSVFSRQVLPTLGPVALQSVTMTMTCGNGTTLSLWDNGQFDGSCYYIEKWDYPISLSITHVNSQTNETRTNTYNVGSLAFVSEISARIQDGQMMRWQGEFVAGKAPRKITWDASAVFRDLALPEYRIVWDVDGDGETDAENVADITWIYNEPKLYNVVVRFPWINNFAYSFPLRVEQPDTPICVLSETPIQGTNYRIEAEMTGRPARIDAYEFSIIDVLAGRTVVGRQNTTTNMIDYNFPWQWVYAVKLDFVTSDGRQGSCESLNISIGQADFSIDYDVYFRNTSTNNFRNVSDAAYAVDGSLVVNELPTVVQLRINDIQPVSATANVSAFFNDVALLSSDDRTFEFRVNQREGNSFSFLVEDDARDARTEIIVPIIVEQAPIVWRLDISPDTVWSEPFRVTFDASRTILNDDDDEIVYFTRDFGDGTIRSNISQSVVSHTYRYDYESDNGIFKPSVEVVTRKWRSTTISLDDDILVKKWVEELDIRVDSHPAQVAPIGETVEFSVRVNGLPEIIVWDFGDWEVIEMPGRQWTSVSHVFTENKNYTITVFVDYENQAPVEGTIVLRVQ